MSPNTIVILGAGVGGMVAANELRSGFRTRTV